SAHSDPWRTDHTLSWSGTQPRMPSEKSLANSTPLSGGLNFGTDGSRRLRVGSRVAVAAQHGATSNPASTHRIAMCSTYFILNSLMASTPRVNRAMRVLGGGACPTSLRAWPPFVTFSARHSWSLTKPLLPSALYGERQALR